MLQLKKSGYKGHPNETLNVKVLVVNSQKNKNFIDRSMISPSE